MRRRWATRSKTPGACWICGGILPEKTKGAGRQAEVCSEVCARDRKAISDLLRTRLRRRRCQLCQCPPAPGSKYCSTHMYRRAPCPTCGGKVRRNEGRGDHPTFCAACRAVPRSRRRQLRQPLPIKQLLLPLEMNP